MEENKTYYEKNKERIKEYQNRYYLLKKNKHCIYNHFYHKVYKKYEKITNLKKSEMNDDIRKIVKNEIKGYMEIYNENKRKLERKSRQIINQDLEKIIEKKTENSKKIKLNEIKNKIEQLNNNIVEKINNNKVENTNRDLDEIVIEFF